MVVVLGKNNYTSYGVIKSLGEAGYNSCVISQYSPFIPRWKADVVSKYTKERYFVRQKNDAGILNILMNEIDTSEGKLLLIPTDDYNVAFVEANATVLRTKYYIPYVKNGSIKLLQQKGYQKRIAEQSGFCVARNWQILAEKSNVQIPQDMVYPCFVKPLISIEGAKSMMRRCNSKEELQQHLSNASAKTVNYCVEEFIDITKEYSVPGYSFGGKVYIPAFCKKLVTSRGSHCGVTVLAEIESASRYLSIVEKITEFVNCCGYNGIFDVEIIESNGKIYFNEINFRDSAAEYGVTTAGVSVPGKYVEAVLNSKFEPEEVNEKVIFINEFAALNEYKDGVIDLKKYKEYVNMATVPFLTDKSDIFAKLSFEANIFRYIILKFLRGVMGTL